LRTVSHGNTRLPVRDGWTRGAVCIHPTPLRYPTVEPTAFIWFKCVNLKPFVCLYDPN